MNVKEEKSFRIDGAQSFVHCIRINKNVSQEWDMPYYHYHEYIEMLYFLEGEGFVYINGTKNFFSSGTFLIVNSKKAHALYFTKPSKYFCVKFMPHVLYESEQSFVDIKYVMPFISEEKNQHIFSRDEIKDTSIEALLTEMMDEWDAMDLGYDLVIRANILKIFSVIFRLWKRSGGEETMKNFSPDIKKAILYTMDHYQTVTEKEVASLCGLSYHYFSHLFRRVVGESFSDYLTSLRISEAEKMLLSTEKSITDIAAETGFSTTSYFISRFRMAKGVTPAKFRKNTLER